MAVNYVVLVLVNQFPIFFKSRKGIFFPLLNVFFGNQIRHNNNNDNLFTAVISAVLCRDLYLSYIKKQIQ